MKTSVSVLFVLESLIIHNDADSTTFVLDVFQLASWSSMVYGLVSSPLFVSCPLVSSSTSTLSSHLWCESSQTVWSPPPSPPALSCSSTSCNVELTEAQGEFTSPCYPQKYPNSQACKWSMQAPAGFIVQLSFLDFDLEEAPGCIYDRVLVHAGSADVRFCGPTANGLTLNSTGNVMELSFTSDFSVQKRGFSVSFRHVAVALRNQKVTISRGNAQVAEVSDSVSMPTLSQLTLCLEVERSSQKQREWIFSYYDSSGTEALSLGSDRSGMTVMVDGVACSVDSILSPADFTSSMRRYCLLWTASDGRVGVHWDGNYRAQTCSSSAGRSLLGGGRFRLGGQQSFDGNVYNLRLWDYAMTVQQLNALSCDAVGNVIDWDNSHWSIPPGSAQTDAALSCSVSPPSSTPLTASCDSPGLGCPAQQTRGNTPAVSSATTNPPATNPAAHATTPVPESVTNQPATNTAATAASSPARPPTKAHVGLALPEGPAPQSEPLRRRRHAVGTSISHAPRPPATIGQTRAAFVPRPLGETPYGGHSAPPTQTPGLPDKAYKPRPLAPAPGSQVPPEPSRPSPQAFLPRLSRQRSSKTSLGFISTPLIWQGRKRPTGGIRPTSNSTPPRPGVHVTKPELRYTAGPTYTTSAGGFKPAAGFLSATRIPWNIVDTTKPTSQTNFAHNDASVTTQDLKVPTEATVSTLSGELYSYRPRGEVSDAKEWTPSFSSSSSLLSNRKNKPGASHWSASAGARENPRVAAVDDYSLGSDALAYDSTELAGKFEVFEFEAAYTSDEADTLKVSDPGGTFGAVEPPAPVPEGGSEHTHSEAVSFISRSQIPTPELTEAVVDHRVPNNPNPSGQKAEDVSYTHTVTCKLDTWTFQPTPSHSRLMNNLFTDTSGQVHIAQHTPSTLSSITSPLLLDILRYSSPPPPFSAIFTSSNAITASASVSAATFQTPSPLLLYSSNTLVPPSSSPLLQSNTPLPSYAHPAELRPSETDVVESSHISVSRNYPPSVLSFPVMSSNLQRGFVVTRVDPEPSLTLPFFSKAPTESQIPVVDAAPLPEYKLVSSEESTNSISDYSESTRPLDVQFGSSGLVDSSFSQIEPTPPGLPFESLASRSTGLSADLPPQAHPAWSKVLWPPSKAGSLSGHQSLDRSSQGHLRDVFASVPAAAMWGSELTPALPQENVGRTPYLHSAPSSAISSSSSHPFVSPCSPLSHHPDNLSLTSSSQALFVARGTEWTAGQETSLSPFSDALAEEPLFLAPSSGSPDVSFPPSLLPSLSSFLQRPATSVVSSLSLSPLIPPSPPSLPPAWMAVAEMLSLLPAVGFKQPTNQLKCVQRSTTYLSTRQLTTLGQSLPLYKAAPLPDGGLKPSLTNLVRFVTDQVLSPSNDVAADEPASPSGDIRYDDPPLKAPEAQPPPPPCCSINKSPHFWLQFAPIGDSLRTPHRGPGSGLDL
ncbi:adhesion G-protein coupled receptor G6 isoform 2-T2 [Spinachia spinachia]